MASTNYINECKNRANANRLGKILIEDVGTSITNSDNLQELTINSSCYVDGNIIGSIYIKKLTGKFIALPNDNELINSKIEAQIGVKFSDNSTEYENIGKYIVDSIKSLKTANMSEITAYDYLINKINEKYISNIDYSGGNITISNLYEDVCNQLGLTPKTLTFLNSDIPISNDPFISNETNMVVLKTIAKISCSYVTIENDNIDLEWISQSDEPDYIFEKNDYATLEGGEVIYGPINSVTIKNSQIDDENATKTDDDSILQNGEHSIIISEDYILNTQELRTQAIKNIFNRLNGFKYIDCKLITYYGKPFLKIGSKIRIMTDDGYFDTYILKHNFVYDGTFASTIESPALTEQNIKTKQNVNLFEIVKNTEIKVDKQNQKIESVVSTQESQSAQLVSQSLTLEGISNSVEETKSKIEQETQDIEELKQRVETNQSSTEYQINVINQTLENGVSKVVTETGYTFDDDGLNISKAGEEMENLITNTGMYVNRDDTNILTADNTGVNAINLHARQYLSVGTHSRWEDYQDGTGCFVVE